MGTEPPTFFSNILWLSKEFFKVFHSPLGVAGGLLDAARGWKFSRSWMSIWLNIPAIALIVAVFGVYIFSQFSRSDGQVQRFLVESESRCATSTLEEACNRIQEPAFVQAYEAESESFDNKKSVAISDLTLKYVELLSKRILAIEHGNQSAKYRLALIHFTTDKRELAESSIDELAEGKQGDFPPANAWVAKRLFIESKSNPRNIPKLVEQLNKASIWKDIDYRLLLIYARYLEATQDFQNAIIIARRAVAIHPSANLDLARLYARVKDEDGLRLCAYAIEDLYVPRLDTPRERDSDRIAIAQVRRLTNRLNLAADVLNDGLRNKTGRPLLRRELCETYRVIYSNSIVQDPDKKTYSADVSLLEKAVEADPDNPNLSIDVAQLLPMNIKATKILRDALYSQMQKNITTSKAYMLMAEGFFGKQEYAQAIQSWRKALEKEPTNVLAMNNLALQLAKDDPKNVSASLEMIAKASNLAPTDAEILDSYGDIYMIAKKYKDAINKYELAIRIDRTRILTRKKVVVAYEAAGMLDMAKSHWKVIQAMEDAGNAEKKKSEEPQPFNRKSLDKTTGP
ncbi:MAG: hypothetical protein ABL921_00470 [Pirellula sp.]